MYLAKVDCADQVLLEILAATLFCSLYYPQKVLIHFAGGLIYSPPISYPLILSVSLLFYYCEPLLISTKLDGWFSVKHHMLIVVLFIDIWVWVQLS